MAPRSARSSPQALLRQSRLTPGCTGGESRCLEGAPRPDRPRGDPGHQPPKRKAAMYAVVRTYSGQGASELFDLLGQREEDVKTLISGVPGFVTYAAIRSGAGGATVTVCEDKAGTDESSRRAAGWVNENMTTDVDPPSITEGDTALQFSAV